MRPQYIEATLLEIKPQLKPQIKPQPKPQKQQQPKINPAEDRAAKQRREEQLKVQRQQKIAKAQAEKQKLAKQQAAKEKVAKEKALKEKARKERAEKQKIQREREAQEQRLLDALAEEEAFIENEQLIGSYSAYIQERVENNWSRPASARRGMVAELSIQLVPTGRVVSVSVVKSSGDEAFDRSAERAVSKVDRFERLQELSKSSPALFDREFRRFRLVFKPEDLRL